MKKMLINATQPEEVRIALVEGNRLYDLVLDNAAVERQKNNIYKGSVTRVEPSLGAVFVEYGSQRHGFLPLKAISHESFSQPPADPQNVKIGEAIKAGDALLVQVEKDERDTKGAMLTTFVKLTGHHLTLMPNNPRVNRMPKRMPDADRQAAVEAVRDLDALDGMGYEIRTADAAGRLPALQRDLERLGETWRDIQAAYQRHKAPELLHKEEGSVMCALRDYVVRDDIDEIWIDDLAVFKDAVEFAGRAMPEKLDKIKLYEDTIPLFSFYQIERQIETAYQREVPLPSGGRLVIDHTEALVTVDVNSARSTGASDIEQTALDTNLEAAAAVALQLRLRDIGGLIVIDFIDMKPKAHGAAVEEALRTALSKDHANIQVGRLSRFGLLEMSRQRIRPSLLESSSQVCSRCDGRGMVRRIKSVALAVYRIIHETAQKEQTAEIRVQASPGVVAWLLNEKRNEISAIERHNNLRLLILPNPGLESPQFEVARLRRQDKAARDAASSYDVLKASVDKIAELRLSEQNAEYDRPDRPPRQAAVRSAPPQAEAPAGRSRRRRSGSRAEATSSAASPAAGWLPKLRGLLFRDSVDGQPGAEQDRVGASRGADAPKPREGQGPQARTRQAAGATAGGRGSRGRGPNSRRGGAAARRRSSPSGSRQPGQQAGGARRRLDGKADAKPVAEAAQAASAKRSAANGAKAQSPAASGDGKPPSGADNTRGRGDPTRRRLDDGRADAKPVAEAAQAASAKRSAANGAKAQSPAASGDGKPPSGAGNARGRGGPTRRRLDDGRADAKPVAEAAQAASAKRSAANGAKAQRPAASGDGKPPSGAGNARGRGGPTRRVGANGDATRNAPAAEPARPDDGA